MAGREEWLHESMEPWVTWFVGGGDGDPCWPQLRRRKGATSPADIQGHWAQEEIQRAMDAGWIDGYPDGTFQPEQTITRAEFTKLLFGCHSSDPPDSEIVAWMKGASQAQAPLEDMADHWLTEGWLDGRCAGLRHGGDPGL